jgi:hypothetical protein
MAAWAARAVVLRWRSAWLTTVLAVSISGNRAASLWLALASCFVETGPPLGRSAGSIDVREAGHVSS